MAYLHRIGRTGLRNEGNRSTVNQLILRNGTLGDHDAGRVVVARTQSLWKVRRPRTRVDPIGDDQIELIIRQQQTLLNRRILEGIPVLFDIAKPSGNPILR